MTTTTTAHRALVRLRRREQVARDAVPVPASAYRDLMSRFPTGVAVVAGLDATGSPQGMTCTSLTSVTLEPPTLMVCLRIGSVTLDAVRHRGLFAVNLLREESASTAARFGRPGPYAFRTTQWRLSPRGMPWLVADAFASADCEVVRLVDVGDHTMVLGTVVDVRGRDGDPLLYGLRQFAAWSRTALYIEEPL